MYCTFSNVSHDFRNDWLHVGLKVSGLQLFLHNRPFWKMWHQMAPPYSLRAFMKFFHQIQVKTKKMAFSSAELHFPLNSSADQKKGLHVREFLSEDHYIMLLAILKSHCEK